MENGDTQPPATQQSHDASVEASETEGPYNASEFSPPLEDDQLPPGSVTLRSMLSFDASKRNPISFLAPDVIVTFSGSTVVIINLRTLQHQYIWGVDQGGIGSVVVHPSKEFFAVAEKCGARAPNVYIYSYPGLKIVKVLKNGTERAYSAASFNHKGNMLATVGSYPDYMLTLWDWEKESVILRAKAFSQEVYTVEFSRYFEGHLITSGTGHIRFWKMAATFTGLKLQGALGKFGNVELTDVAAFIEMEDGKVLSGTENGELLLWDGGLIKAVFTRSGGCPCHEGNINVVLHDTEAGHILTAGVDGVVRIWDFNTVRDAEPEDGASTVDIAPLDEVTVHDDCRVRSMIREKGQWIIFAESGGIYRVTLPPIGALSRGARTEELIQFTPNAVVGLETLPRQHMAITAAGDGSIRLFNYEEGKELCSIRFSSAATRLLALSESLDPEHRTVLVGFEDGTVRALSRCEDGWKLLSVFKPHKTRVTAMAISPAGKLVTGSSDGRLFFFNIESPQTYAPIAYTTLSSPVCVAAWNSSTTHVVVGCENGRICEVEAPEDCGEEQSFERDLRTRQYLFKLPKKPKAATEKTNATGADDGGNHAVEGGDTGGTAEESRDQGDQEQPGGDEEDESEEFFMDSNSTSTPVTTIMFCGIEKNVFCATFGGVLAGKVYKCSFDAPEVLGSFPATEQATSTLRFSRSGKFLLMGSANGVVRITPTEHVRQMSGTQFWEGGVHDGQYGKVTGVALSFDDKYLLSVAEDMTFYIQEVNMGETAGTVSMPVSEVLPKIADDKALKVKDITDSNAYTIEEAKQKEEEDMIKASAEGKKRRVRDYLDNLRRQFEDLVGENDARPPKNRIPKEYFEIDPGLKVMIEEQTKQREDIAKKETQWERERSRVALEKLNQRFLDNVEVERVTLHSFDSTRFVTSFRTAKLAPGIDEHIRHLEAKIEEHRAAQKDQENSGGIGNSAQTDGNHQGASFGKGGVQTVGFNTENTTDGNGAKLTKADLRRIARKKREEHWAAYNAMRPSEDEENRDDLAAIEEAQRTMGDFKLKTDPAFVVPEDERMTPDKKRLRMLELEKGLHDLKMTFNRDFMDLRDGKKLRCAEIAEKNGRLREINEGLGIKGEIADPAMRSEEVPESRVIVSDSDINAYVVQCEEEASKATNSLGGFAGGSGNKKQGKTEKANAVRKESVRGGEATSAKKGDHVSAVLSSIPPSETEKEERRFRKRQLELEREALLEEINSIKNEFDEEIQQLRKRKYALEADLKYGEMRWLVMFKELILLNEFEKREVVLSTKLHDKMADRSQVLEKIAECQDKLEQKKVELESLEERQRGVVREFDEMVPENHDAREALSKIFFRKIKRSKKRAGGDEDDEDDSDEDYEDDDFDDEEEEEDDEEEVCPPGCDQELYASVCDLREKRLDEDDLLAEFQKSIEQIKKDKEQASKKLKLVDQSLAAINQDITEFQKEKQGKLNELDVVVMMRLSQIECLVDGRLPTDLSKALVFSKSELQRLKKRISELDEERSDLRKTQRELRKDYVQLMKDKRAKEDRIAELETRMHDVQILKFGQVIDLDLLDKVQMNHGTDELREQVRQQERKFAQEIGEWERKIALRTEELAVVTSENTAYLNKISSLTRFQMDIEQNLATAQTRMLTDQDSKRRKEIGDRERMVHLVNDQAKKIEALKKQLQLLKRKDTSVYGYVELS